MEQIVEDLVAKYDRKPDIFNTMVAKGAIVITSPETGDLWFAVDKKTPGYGWYKFVGKYVEPGGNLTGETVMPNITPLRMYKRRINSELSEYWPGRLVIKTRPHADYMGVLTVEDHGKEDMVNVLPTTNGIAYTLVSHIIAEVDRADLETSLGMRNGELKLPNLLETIHNNYKAKNKVPAITIFGRDNLEAEVDNFADADGVKFADCLHDLYGINVSATPRNGNCYRLSQSYARVPYETREEMQFVRVNPFRQGTVTKGPSPFKPV